MNSESNTPPDRTTYAASARAAWLVACAAALTSACGGGTSTDVAPVSTGVADVTPAAEIATGATTLDWGPAEAADPQAVPNAAPAFHAAPVLLDEPPDADAGDPAASGSQPPHTQGVPTGAEGLSSSRLTVQQIESSRRARALGAPTATGEETAAPLATGSTVSTYSPAQIRAAYGLPALPAAGAIGAVQAAQLGAGQTIYIVNAMHNPNVVAELDAFNTKFGLPACTTRPIATTAALPLAKSSATGCDFSVVYTTAAGAMTTQAPAYESGWATEIALDVQWAHATAPLARIVLIEAPDASVSSLSAAVRLANAMGPGVVSMSFGANEGSYTAAMDPAFTGTGMSYVAATGDNGAGVSWPSVSPKVLAVGGTSLSYAGGSAARSEVAWSGTGGGTSAYTPTPSYQTAAVPGLGQPARRTVADVAFNANPSTGQYVAVLTPGSATMNWISAGGTSLSTPQWAGLLAVANALRAQAAKPVIGLPHPALYGQIGAVPGTYARSFADIVSGTNGSCGACAAKPGHDPLTGLGTPQGTSLLQALAGTADAPVAPVVTSATISGEAGTPLSFTVSTTAPNPVTYTLAGAPAGLAINAAGAVTWAAPVPGSWSLTVTATDSKTGLSGRGVYTLTIAAKPAAAAPVVDNATISGRPGTALSFTVPVKAANPVTWSLTGAPAGLAVSSTGVVNWPSPVAGTHTVTVAARDTRTGLTGTGVYTLQIAASGPVISAPPMTGVAGRPLSGQIVVSASGATSLSVSISGAPMGMMFSASGMTLTALWASPVAGSYALAITAVDSAGRRTSATVPITIAAK
jgi:hypothetical protein